MNIYINSKGISLVIVMLIILAVTSIAIVSLRTTQNDLRQVSGFSYNRQAAQGAHSAGIYINTRAAQDAQIAAAEAAQNAVQAVMNAADENQLQAAISGAGSSVKWYYPNDVAPFSGMNKTIPNDTDESSRLKGDLARPSNIVASLGNMSLINKPVAGFSEGDAFCSYDMHADAYALIGRSVPIRNIGGNQYYLLSDLNARISGFKREMGLLDVTPLPCKQY